MYVRKRYALRVTRPGDVMSERCFFGHPLERSEFKAFGPVLVAGRLRMVPLCRVHTPESFLEDCSITRCMSAGGSWPNRDGARRAGSARRLARRAGIFGGS